MSRKEVVGLVAIKGIIITLLFVMCTMCSFLGLTETGVLHIIFMSCTILYLTLFLEEIDAFKVQFKLMLQIKAIEDRVKEVQKEQDGERINAELKEWVDSL